MTQDEAVRYCEERGIGPSLTRAERLALSAEDFRMFIAAYPIDPAEVSNIAWAAVAGQRTAATVAQREQARQLRNAAGL